MRKPAIQLNVSQLHIKLFPMFFGVALERVLYIRPHVTAVVSKAFSRRGWRKDQLRKAYGALHLSVVNYIATAWLRPDWTTWGAARTENLRLSVDSSE